MKRQPLMISRRVVRSASGLMLALAGCQSNESTLRLQPTGSSSRTQQSAATLTVDPDSPHYNANTGRIELSGAIDEVLTFGLHLRAGGAPVEELGVELVAEQFADGSGNPAVVRWYRLHAVRIEPADRLPGWHVRLVEPSRRRHEIDDVLVPIDAPRGGLPTTIPAGGTLHLFAEMRIAKGTKPGVHAATVRITRRGDSPYEVPLHVTVWPFLLPRDSEYTLLASLDHHQLFRQHVRIDGKPYRPMRMFGETQTSSSLEGLFNDTIHLLRRYGVTPVPDRIYPVVKLGGALNLTTDWKDYDRAMAPYFDGRRNPSAGIPTWCKIPFDERFPAIVHSEGMDELVRARLIEQYLAQCAAHFAQRGWLDRAYLEIPEPDLPSPQAAHRLRFYSETVRRFKHPLRLLTHWFPDDPLESDWPLWLYADVLSRVDIWCPPAQFCVPTTAAGAPEKWLGLDRPPYSGTLTLGAPDAFVRVIPWQARRYDMRTVQLPAALNWPDSDPPVTPQMCTTFDRSSLLYPGSAFGLSHPLASMRLVQLHRGMQDLAYVKLLEIYGLEHVAESVTEALSPYALTDAYRNHFADIRPCGWAQDSQVWETARLIMADEICKKLGPADAPGDHLDRAVRWQQFMSQARSFQLRVEGVRVRPTRQIGVTRIEFTVTLDNLARTPVGGELSFVQLPIGWTALEAGKIISPVDPMQTRRVTLVANATGTIAWDDGGVTHIPIRLETFDGRTYEAVARLAYVASQRRENPIEIDGDLSDWPVGGWNVAAHFVPITGPTAEAPNRETGQPLQQTHGFVLHDESSLFIALYGEDASPVSEATSHRNFVTYDDMVPVDEDLFEIVIDPSNAATHSSEDLYHIVIMRGAALFERGVGTDPPTGNREVWAADIRYATRTTERGWTAEVRIPWNSFSQDQIPTRTLGKDSVQPPPRIWGINFARFDASRRIYTTWSGAMHNVYDPMLMGNLVIP